MLGTTASRPDGTVLMSGIEVLVVANVGLTILCPSRMITNFISLMTSCRDISNDLYKDHGRILLRRLSRWIPSAAISAPGSMLW